jgi:hypothetical protein
MTTFSSEAVLIREDGTEIPVTVNQQLPQWSSHGLGRDGHPQRRMVYGDVESG